MIERMHLSVVLLAAAIIWGVLLVLDGVVVSLSWLRHVSVVAGAVLLLLSAFDLFLWRLPALHSWFVRRPNLRGTWRATLRSNWVDPATGATVPPIMGYMAISQTFSRLSLRLMTEESRSEILGAEILRSEDGTYRVVGVYRNEPKLSVRHRSPIHNGAVLLQALGSPPSSLEGHYWTDRNTAGELVLTERKRKLVDDLKAASVLYAET